MLFPYYQTPETRCFKENDLKQGSFEMLRAFFLSELKDSKIVNSLQKYVEIVDYCVVRWIMQDCNWLLYFSLSCIHSNVCQKKKQNHWKQKVLKGFTRGYAILFNDKTKTENVLSISERMTRLEPLRFYIQSIIQNFPLSLKIFHLHHNFDDLSGFNLGICQAMRVFLRATNQTRMEFRLPTFG